MFLEINGLPFFLLPLLLLPLLLLPPFARPLLLVPPSFSLFLSLFSRSSNSFFRSVERASGCILHFYVSRHSSFLFSFIFSLPSSSSTLKLLEVLFRFRSLESSAPITSNSYRIRGSWISSNLWATGFELPLRNFCFIF